MNSFISPFFLMMSFLVSGVALPALAAPVIQDFKTKLYHGNDAHPWLWAIEIAPPADHHFNLEAPRSAQQEKFKFEIVEQSAEKILFQLDQPGVHAGSVAEVSAFVCDEKKTYCMKKKMFITLNAAKAETIVEKFSAVKPAKIAALPVSVKKEKEIFIDNNPALALNLAQQTKKPVLIDFYGIWCPPCNLYNETIFETAGFAAQSKRFVLLKLDVDAEKSFDLKSQFKIGGYPTLLIAKVNAHGKWEEVERIVGYFPPNEFYARLDQAYAHRNDTVAQRWTGRLEALLSSEMEQKNYDHVIELTEKNVDAHIQLYRWMAEVKKNAAFLQDPKNLELVKDSLLKLAKESKQQTSDTLVHAVDFLSDEFWLKQVEYKKMASDFLDQLQVRIDPKTMFVKGSELTAPDLEAIRMDLAESAGDDTLVPKIRKKAIAEYEKLIRFFEKNGKKDLRSMNLEYAYLLWKDERIAEAKKLYQQFMEKFPGEFTFYYAASKMYLTLKEYPKAHELAEKALQYSYGDNRIRAMDRLVSIIGEEGRPEEAILRGNEFLKAVKVPAGLNVRTGRYVDALKATIAKLEKAPKKEEAKK